MTKTAEPTFLNYKIFGSGHYEYVKESGAGPCPPVCSKCVTPSTKAVLFTHWRRGTEMLV